MKELYKRYRPKTFDKILGQDHVIESLKGWIEERSLPHTLLFSGPSGCGKTTLARILRRKLGCGKHDFVEINCADFRGIDTVRRIRSRMHLVAISGKCRIWLIDEAHKLSNDAQNAFLKMLEDTPSHVYFMLATTNPHKLLKTIRNRCSELTVKSLTIKVLIKLLRHICKEEKAKISKEVINKIAEHSEGSARKALVILGSVIKLKSKESMLEAIENTTLEKQSEFIARLLFKPSIHWKDIAEALKVVENNEAETIRRGVLGYAKAVLLSGGRLSKRAFVIIEVFSDNYFDSGAAGLAYSCYEAMILGSKTK